MKFNLIESLIICILIAIGINVVCCTIYSINKDNKNREAYYKDFDVWCQYIKDNSMAYDLKDKEFMLEQYKLWKENEGYGDIIIDTDGYLVNIYTDGGY